MSEVVKIDIEGSPLARGNIPAVGLPEGYIDESLAAIRSCARVVPFKLGVTGNNRDYDHIGQRLASVVAPGAELVKELPWLEEYYRGELRAVASEAIGEDAICLKAMNEAVLGLAFGPGMRIEAHTDVWAINTNLYLKTAGWKEGLPPELSGGTVIGHKNARSHTEIIDNPLAVLPGKQATLGIIACSEYPHTIGVPEAPANFVMPDITTDAFWEHSDTRVSFNISYSTAAQLEAHPHMQPMTEEVGFSKPVLGIS